MSTTKTAKRTQYPEQHERDAARRYLEHDHASRTLKGEPGHEANRHAQAIDEEHPRARDIALAGTARELGKLPAHLARHQRQIRQEAGIDQAEANRMRREFRSGPYQEEEPREPAPSPSGGSSVGSDALDFIGSGVSSAANTSWGQLVGEFFFGGIVLSIAYLILTKDTAAVSEFFKGFGNATRAVVSPHVDPLNPKGIK